MIFKIKKFLLLIFLLLLQSCAGSRIGNFFESSFDNLENIKNSEDRKVVVDNQKILNQEIKERKKKNIKSIKNTDRKLVLDNKAVLNLEKKSEITNKKKKVNNSFKKTKNELQSYKIIFILKDVDPQDPLEEFITILRNSEVNFEIEKIERFLDSKNKI